MLDISGFRALLSATPTEEILLDVYLNHELSDIVEWAESPFMPDGLSLETCHDLVLARAMEMFGSAAQAENAAVMLSVIAPMAHSLDDLDAALGATGRWMAMLSSSDATGLPLYRRIAAIKGAYEKSGLLDADTDDMDAEELIRFHASMDIYEHVHQQGRLGLTLGGREFEMVVTPDEIVVATDMGDGDWDAVCAWPHNDQSDGGDGGDDDPEDAPDPSPRLLQDA